MDQPDPTIHQPIRLKIMAALKPLPDGGKLEFVRLKDIVGTTDGNLGAHLTTLEIEGYVDVEKDFVGRKPRTRIGLSRAGRRAFEDYVNYLRDVIGAG
ncbi:MAG: winged helix-turn-helix domain-containing protein [Rhizomicrobium sp.]